MLQIKYIHSIGLDSCPMFVSYNNLDILGWFHNDGLLIGYFSKLVDENLSV